MMNRFQTKLPSASSISGNDEQVSRLLFNRLNAIGLSEDAIHVNTNYYRRKDLIRNLDVDSWYWQFIGGSKAEGVEMMHSDKSDEDIMFIWRNIQVQVQHGEWRDENKIVLFARPDETYPGYYLLQLVHIGGTCGQEEIHFFHTCSRCLMERTRFLSSYLSANTFAKRDAMTPSVKHLPVTGPSAPNCIYAGDTIASFDNVMAFHCSSWPAEATEWQHRDRSGWPSPKQIDMTMSMGCLFVPTGVDESPMKDFQFRLSFSLQEKYLVTSFNNTQYKVYYLLKAYKRIILARNMTGGEYVKTLSSYHLKTVLLWNIEYRPEKWIPENLVVCFLDCITIVLQFVQESHFPNYFLPQNNMFPAKVMRVREILITTLQDTLERATSGVINLVDHVISEKPELPVKLYELIVLLMLDRSLFQGIAIATRLNIKCSMETRECVFTNTMNTYTCAATRSAQCTFDFVRKIFNQCEYTDRDLIIKHVQAMNTCLGSHMLAHAVSCTANREMYPLYKMAREKLELGSQSDVCAGRLKLAYYYFVIGSYNKAVRIIQEVTDDYKNHVQRACMFGTIAIRFDERSRAYCDVMTKEDVPVHVKLEKYCALDVCFTPAEEAIVTRGLQFELFKSSCGRGSVIFTDNGLFLKWAVVDPEAFMYYLLFNIHHDTGNTVHRNVALDNLKWTASKTKDVCYRATTWNILGHCYVRMDDSRQALRCFIASYNAEPLHDPAYTIQRGEGNCVLWHLFLLVGRNIRHKT